MPLAVWGVSRTVRKENSVGDVFAEKFIPERKKEGSCFWLQESPTRISHKISASSGYSRFFSQGVKPKFGKESISTGLGSLMEETAARIGGEQVEVLGADVESRLQDNLGVRYRGNES